MQGALSPTFETKHIKVNTRDMLVNVCNENFIASSDIIYCDSTLESFLNFNSFEPRRSYSTGGSDDYFQPIFITRETLFFFMFRP